jgi:hypothetical protein
MERRGAYDAEGRALAGECPEVLDFIIGRPCCSLKAYDLALKL